MAETQSQDDLNEKLKAAKGGEPNEEHERKSVQVHERRSDVAMTPHGTGSSAGSPIRRNKTKGASSVGTQDSVPRARGSHSKKKIKESMRDNNSVPAETSKKISKKMKGNGIQLSQPRVFFDEEKVKFKLLANFLNCYKEKLQLSGKEEDTEDQVIAEVMQKIQAEVDKKQPDQTQSQRGQSNDISIDFMQFQIIKHMEEVQNAKDSKKKTLYPTVKAQKKEEKNTQSQGEIFRERVSNYIDGKKKFQNINYSKGEQKTLSYQETLDMAKRPKVIMSSFGKELMDKQKRAQREIKSIQKSMCQTQSFIKGTQERKKKLQEDIFIDSQIKEIRNNQIQFNKTK